MTSLLVGGAGYVGSHVVEALVSAGLKVIVLDNLSTAKRERLPVGVELIIGDAKDPEIIRSTCQSREIVSIFHFAALKSARESQSQPLEYWSSNIGTLLGVLHGIAGTSVKNLIFSSSCSIYGDRSEESGFTGIPKSAYARTKQVSEMILEDVAKELGLKLAILRYFNAVGASDFPFACDLAADALLPKMIRDIYEKASVIIYGADYPSPDGTAVRDYVDVRDVASAHLHALRRLIDSDTELFISDVSSGKPRSVKEIVDKLREISGQEFEIEYLDRASGDPARIWSEPSPELLELGWRPKYSIEDSIASQLSSLSKTLNVYQGMNRIDK